MNRIAKIIAAALLMIVALTGCDDGNPCEAQPNPDKQAICLNETGTR